MGDRLSVGVLADPGVITVPFYVGLDDVCLIRRAVQFRVVACDEALGDGRQCDVTLFYLVTRALDRNGTAVRVARN